MSLCICWCFFHSMKRTIATTPNTYNSLFLYAFY